MTTITCTIPDALGKKLARAAKQRRVPKATLVREGLAVVLAQPPALPGQPLSMWERSKDLCGSLDSGRGDRSSSKKHLIRMGAEETNRGKKTVTPAGKKPARPLVSALDVMGNLRGIFNSGIGDLSTNKKHLAGLGREKFRS